MKPAIQRIISIVSDDGVGPDRPSANPGTGIGLKNSRERIHLLFGGDGEFDLSPGRDGGTVVTVRWPLAQSPQLKETP